MQAQCPQCQTLFNITQRHLNMANGRVRCSRCHHVFDGYSALIDEDADSTSPSATASNKTNSKHDGNKDDIQLNLDKDEKGNRIDIDPNAEKKPKNLIYGNLLEDDYDKPRRNQKLRRRFFALIVFLGILGVLAQTAYANRAWLADQPQTKKWVTLICGYIPRCTIPEKRALNSIKLDSRHIYGHPNMKGALVVSASFSNRSSFTQPYPILMISMSNIRGQEVASRRFKPEEYLQNQKSIQNGFSSGSNVTVNLEIADPGNDAMAFEIDFL